MKKRVLPAILAAALLLSIETAKAAEVETSAASAVLMDAFSGRVLYEKNAHEPRLIASITKLMTALVAVRVHPDLSDVVTVEAQWLVGAEGSSIYLSPGEQLTLEELLYGMLLESGNDAAQAAACFCAGDLETFAQWMNECAADLGMKNSSFSNPSGLNAEDHYSTAYDMALCAAACMENEAIAQMVGSVSATFGDRTYYNHNRLLSLYEGCVGMKTGYTQLAGRTLVSCAERDGQRLIAVTLSAPNDWNDHMALYDHGFSHYEVRELCAAGQTVRMLPVTGSLVRFVEVQSLASLSYPLAEDEQVETVIRLPDQTAAPVVEGSIAGSMEFYLDGALIGSTYLVYAASVDSNLFAQRSLIQRAAEWLRGETAAFLPIPMM